MSGRRIGVTPTSSFKAERRSADTSGVNGSNSASNTATTLNAAASSLSHPSRTNTRSNSKSSGASRGGRGGSNNKDDKKSFNPRLIFAQIVALQCFHYVFLGLLFQINRLFFGTSITIDRIFTAQYIKIWSSKGLPDTFAVLLSSIVGAVLLAIIVEKSKKCLDFCCTLFLIHLSACTVYDGMPATWDWWIVNIMGTIIMILLGEYVCSLREMKEIPLLEI